MLKEKYRFRMDYTAWTQICAQLKSLQENAVIMPHQRTKAKRVQLAILSALRPLMIRLDKRLCQCDPEFSFEIKQYEALAFLVAYENGWIKALPAMRDIVNVIDRVV